MRSRTIFGAKRGRRSSVSIAAKHSRYTAMLCENTAAMPAMWQIGSVSAMHEADFKRERLYQATMRMVRKMLTDGVINHQEYAAVEKLMMEKYHPILGTLFSDISLT